MFSPKQLHGIRLCRYARQVHFDEYLKMPILKASEMSPDQLSLVANHIPPVSPQFASRNLQLAFHEPFLKTDWTLYKDPVLKQDEARAAQLLTDLLLEWRKRPDKCPQDWVEYAKWVSEFVKEECVQLQLEIDTGMSDRWCSKEYLYGEWLQKLSAEALKTSEPAFRELAETPLMHPLLKKEILGHICSVLHEASSTKLKISKE